MKQYVILAAGGSGTRMQSDIPKQFLLLNEKPLLIHSIFKFRNALPDIHIIIAAHQDYIDYTTTLLSKYGLMHHTVVTQGGETRFHSVQNGIATIADEEAIVFVHDAARCLVSEELILRCHQACLEFGNAVPATKSTDSLRLVKKSSNAILDREKVRIIQTPQTFKLSVLRRAFTQQHLPHFTDEASVLESIGEKIHLVEGETSNIKITTPFDMSVAQVLLGA
jgi:2-C-methyl-D-erythritol 4-phosphate cytidylyltransferase